jgi:hypothetical protein
MLRLDKVIKPWKESASLNDHINLYGFWNETVFLTKSGDVGMVLSVPGVDYESLDRSEQEYAVKRLEAALKAFGPGFHVYQYLFKSNRPDIPFAKYDDPIVEAAIEQRRKFFEAKRDHLYQVEIFYCILLEGARSKTGVGAAIARILRDPAGAVGELKVQFTNDSMKTLLRTHIEHDLRRQTRACRHSLDSSADFMQIEILNQQGQFMFFRRLLNYDDRRVAGRPQSTQFLDYQVVNSNIEAERDHLRVGDHIVRVLTMKEAITETRPMVLDALLKIPANFYVVTEWTPLPADKARNEVNKRRRHFNMSKTGFVSQMGNDATKTNPRDVLVDESKQADIENLGDCLRALGDGQSLGDFSLTIVLYGRSKAELEQLGADFTGIFTNADGNLFAETYNQLNAYFATVPGNYALNLRKLYLLNTNYADLSFLFTILPGEKTNTYLGTDEMPSLTHHASTYQLLYVSDGNSRARPALADVGSGQTAQPTAACTFRAGEAAGLPLAVPRTAARLLEQDSSRSGLYFCAFCSRKLQKYDLPLPVIPRMSVWATSPLCRLRKYGVLLSVGADALFPVGNFPHAAIAKSYAAAPENTLIVSPDNASRRELNAAVRQKLKATGALATEDHTFRVLVPRQDMTGAERSWASHYEIDDVVRYTRGSRTVGIDVGSYASVAAINPAANQLTVEKANGEIATYDPRRLTGVSVYQEIERQFSVGDRIQFTAPDKSLGVANRELATIETVHPNGRLSAHLANNRQIEFNPNEHRHFGHGYAVPATAPRDSPPNASSFTPTPASTRTCSTPASATSSSPAPATRPRSSPTTWQNLPPGWEPMSRRPPPWNSTQPHPSRKD